MSDANKEVRGKRRIRQEAGDRKSHEARGQAGFETGGNDPMRSMNLIQLVGGVAVAGVVAAGTTALTGTGVVWGGGATGTTAQYVGGTLTQTVTGGASITSIVYAANAAGTQVTGMTLTIANANGAWLTVTPSNSSVGFAGTADEWKCSGSVVATVQDATAPHVHLNNDPAVVLCVTAISGTHAPAGYYSNLNGVQVDVTNS